jgi:hypothetical protein
MTLREFISENTVTSIQYVDDVIFNVICDGTPYGLDVDTSNIEGGTVLLTATDFVLTENELIFGNTTLDLDNTNLLG